MNPLDSLSNQAAEVVTSMSLGRDPGEDLRKALAAASAEGGPDQAQRLLAEVKQFAGEARRASASGSPEHRLAMHRAAEAIYGCFDAPSAEQAEMFARFAAEPRPSATHPQLRTTRAPETTKPRPLGVWEVRNILSPAAGRALATALAAIKAPYEEAAAVRGEALLEALRATEARDGLGAAQAQFAAFRTYVRVAWATAAGSWSEAFDAFPAELAMRRKHPVEAERYLGVLEAARPVPELAGATTNVRGADKQRAVLAILAACFDDHALADDIKQPLWSKSTVRMRLNGDYELHVPDWSMAQRVEKALAVLDPIGRPAKIRVRSAAELDRRKAIHEIADQALGDAKISRNVTVSHVGFDHGYTVDLLAPKSHRNKADAALDAIRQAVEMNGEPWVQVRPHYSEDTVRRWSESEPRPPQRGPYVISGFDW